MVIVINTVDVQPCTQESDDDCPDDGNFLWNTDVVFSAEGVVIAKYAKGHIFSTSKVLDQPRKIVPTFFSMTSGLRFGIIICFDMEFADPATELLAMGIKHFVVSSSWLNYPPFLTATMYQQGWSRTKGIFSLRRIPGRMGASG